MKGNANPFNYQIIAMENVVLEQNSVIWSIWLIDPEPDEKDSKVS